MADENLCESCGETFPTSRGLNIHVTRVHSQADNPTKGGNTTFEDAKKKFDQIVLKARISKVANLFLGRMADKYQDPEIRLNPAECNDVDGVFQEMLADTGSGTIKSIAPYLPWIGAIMILGPIAIDKFERITSHSAQPTPPKHDSVRAEKASEEVVNGPPPDNTESTMTPLGPSGESNIPEIPEGVYGNSD